MKVGMRSTKFSIETRQGTRQFLKFAVVGVMTNILLYAGYLAVTAFGVMPKVAMTVTYVVGVLFSFWLNRSWTYRKSGEVSRHLRRYVVAYVVGYVVNLCGLYIGVDVAGVFHAYVQGVMVVVVACLMFVLQRHWVFIDRKVSSTECMES